ncbi:MAG: GyrI-like domain-containing protein [Clostridiales bacterium]|nr:MAG: GyrI-like domain-containing protein [Clostridiales bacterium]
MDEDYFTVETIPAHTYAVFKCTGKMPEAFQKVYKYICTEFFSRRANISPAVSRLKAIRRQIRKNADYTCEIWIAVEKKLTN